jgi:hypothetical protein
VAVEVAGGLIDVYLDLNHPVWQRIRLDTITALKLYRALGATITCLPIRLTDTGWPEVDCTDRDWPVS